MPMRKLLSFSLLLLLSLTLPAQRGIGVRFGADFNHFLRADQFPLEDGWWSQLVFGPYYQAYFEDGGAQIGLNILYKNNTGKGFPNFPVIQRDYGDDDQNIGVTALELDLKVGPRFGLFNPKIGTLVNYSLRRDGFLDSGQVAAMNRVFVALPLGLSIEGPTGYGSVGFGAFYTIGINNVLRNPTPGGLQDYNGSKIRGLRFEFFILFEAGKQAPKIPGPELIEE
jgi:hypothetical protein